MFLGIPHFINARYGLSFQINCIKYTDYRQPEQTGRRLANGTSNEKAANIQCKVVVAFEGY